MLASTALSKPQQRNCYIQNFCIRAKAKLNCRMSMGRETVYRLRRETL
jgi:hypothetical protein